MKERYENLDGFRAFAAIGIILMHVRANGNFGIYGFVYDKVIASFTNLTFFFMLLSAFSMCCGYYERFQKNEVSLEQFYKRRYQRIWPFFALLCTVELIVDHSLTSLYEWFADLTLAFRLLPNADISVVGVGWFLGVIFAFYMVFPFFVFLMGNKRRAWFVLGVTIVLNLLCYVYFFDTNHVVNGFAARTNLIYSSIFFVAGGLIYLYRDKIKELIRVKQILFAAMIAAAVFYYTMSSSVFTMVVLFSLFTALGILGGGIAKTVFQNKAVRFLSSVSMEIYLCHMFVFRVIEKLHLLHITGNEILNYVMVGVATICGAIIMALILKKMIELLTRKLQKA